MLVIEPYEAQGDNEINLVKGEYIYDVDVEQLEDGWCSGTTEDGKRGVFPASYVTECAEVLSRRRILTVLVTSPYKAQEDGEINLVEGEYVYDVEPFDDGWWRGTAEDGRRGMFPASYVEESAPPSPLVPPSVRNRVYRSGNTEKKKKRKRKVNDDDPMFSKVFGSDERVLVLDDD